MPIKSTLEYSVGDKLKIRSWNDMAEEFGDNYGVIDTGNILFSESMRYLCEETFTIECNFEGNKIPCLFGFAEYMRGLCGKSFTVKEAAPIISSNGVWRCAYSSVEGIEGHYLISSDMLEYVNENNDNAIINMADESELKAFLFG